MIDCPPRHPRSRAGGCAGTVCRSKIGFWLGPGPSRSSGGAAGKVGCGEAGTGGDLQPASAPGLIPAEAVSGFRIKVPFRSVDSVAGWREVGLPVKVVELVTPITTGRLVEESSPAGCCTSIKPAWVEACVRFPGFVVGVTDTIELPSLASARPSAFKINLNGISRQSRPGLYTKVIIYTVGATRIDLDPRAATPGIETLVAIVTAETVGARRVANCLNTGHRGTGNTVLDRTVPGNTESCRPCPGRDHRPRRSRLESGQYAEYQHEDGYGCENVGYAPYLEHRAVPFRLSSGPCQL